MQAGWRVGLGPPTASTPTLRKGVNVFLARTEEIEKIHAYVFAGLGKHQKNQVSVGSSVVDSAGLGGW